MKLFKLVILLFTLTFAISCGQQKRYVTYKVKQGETMRDIADRLNISTKDLLRLNPDVGREPNANTTIIIPNQKNTHNNTVTKTENDSYFEKDTVIDSTNQPTDSIKQSEEFSTIEKVVIEYVTHEVKPKETLYSLSKKYDTTVDMIKELNPELIQNELGIGQIIKVKKITKKVLVQVKNEDLIKNAKDFVTHTVQPKETVFSLVRFYNITEPYFYMLNPEVKEYGLKIGQVVRIKSLSPDIASDKVYVDSINFDLLHTIKLAMLIPFNAKEYDSIKSDDIFKDNPLPNIVTEFYSGAEMAIDSIRNQGISIDVTVLDTEKKLSKTEELINNKVLNNKDVVIGPFFSEEATLLASKIDSVPFIFPMFSKNQKLFTSNNIIKTQPDKEQFVYFLVDFLKKNYKNENIFVVGDGGEESNLAITSIVAGLKTNDSIKEVHVLKSENGYLEKTRFTDYMKPKSHSWIIMTSDDVVAVSDALNSMLVLPEETTAQVFAIEKNKAYDKIDNNKLSRIGFTYVSDTYSDESLYNIRKFNNLYERKNHTIPSTYATQGFDITYDVLMRLASGKKLDETFKDGISMRFQSMFNYGNSPLGAKNNNGLFLVRYEPDLSLKKLN